MSKTISFDYNEDKYDIFIPSYSDLIELHKDKNIKEVEEYYYNLLGSFYITPTNFAVGLDDAGIDFTSITNFELFCAVIKQNEQTNNFLELTISVNGNKFRDYDVYEDKITKEIVLYNLEYEHKFTEDIYNKIFDIITNEFNIKNEDVEFISEDAKKLWLENERRKQHKHRNKKENIRNIINDLMELQNNIKITLDMPISEFYKCDFIKDFAKYLYYKNKKEVD